MSLVTYPTLGGENPFTIWNFKFSKYITRELYEELLETTRESYNSIGPQFPIFVIFVCGKSNTSKSNLCPFITRYNLCNSFHSYKKIGRNMFYHPRINCILIASKESNRDIRRLISYGFANIG